MLKDTDLISWIILILLTLLLIAGLNQKNQALLILIVAAGKFLLVAFQFMEIRKAHIFWKILIISIVLLISVALYLVRSVGTGI